MLIESLVKSTLELQGFRVVAMHYDGDELEAEMAPDRRCRPCVAVAIDRRVTETPAGPADSATCRSGA
jgi:hypothetical protein